MRACRARGRDAPLFGLFRTISWRRPWGRKRVRERRREEDARRGRRARRSRGRPRQSRTAGAPSRAPCGGGGEKTVVFCQYLDTVRFIRDLILSKTGRARRTTSAARTEELPSVVQPQTPLLADSTPIGYADPQIRDGQAPVCQGVRRPRGSAPSQVQKGERFAEAGAVAQMSHPPPAAMLP